MFQKLLMKSTLSYDHVSVCAMPKLEKMMIISYVGTHIIVLCIVILDQRARIIIDLEKTLLDLLSLLLFIYLFGSDHHQLTN